MRSFPLFVCGSAILAMSTVAKPDVIAYTNFGKDMAFNNKLGLFVGGDKAEYQADEFTSLATGKLSKIIVALSGVVVKKGDNFNISLYTEDQGVPKFSLLGFLGYTPPMTLGDSKPLLNLVPGPLGMIQLTKGTNYFVVISPGVGTSIAAWNLSDPNVMAGTATMDNTNNKWVGSQNSSQGALQVQVAPAPPSFVAFGLGFGALALFRRRSLSR